MTYNRKYIGSRYVPKFASPLAWSSSNTYEPLTIVTYDGDSYTSRQFVPEGIAISNENYWALTGNYNAQIESYREETAAVAEDLDDVSDTVDNHSTAITELSSSVTDNTADIVALETFMDTIDGKVDDLADNYYGGTGNTDYDSFSINVPFGVWLIGAKTSYSTLNDALLYLVAGWKRQSAGNVYVDLVKYQIYRRGSIFTEDTTSTNGIYITLGYNQSATYENLTTFKIIFGTNDQAGFNNVDYRLIRIA